MQVMAYPSDMGNVNTVITLEQLGNGFDGMFKRSAFRLLTLDSYLADNEREPYARFLAGEPVDPAWREPWKSFVRSVRKSGRTMARVHIVAEPLTDYMRFSVLHGYPANVEAGEDVSILGRKEAAGLVNVGDWWLFDGKLAAFLVYNDAGAVERIELDGDPVIAEMLRDIQREAKRLAVPLADYAAEHNITERTAA